MNPELRPPTQWKALAPYAKHAKEDGQGSRIAVFLFLFHVFSVNAGCSIFCWPRLSDLGLLSDDL